MCFSRPCAAFLRGLKYFVVLQVLTFALGGALVPTTRAGVIIHEVMYQPPGLPENTALEFIELCNTDTVPTDVSGWQFTKGIAFTFPSGTTIPAGGYLVVVPNVTAFQGAYPGVTNVVGNWSGTLSNTGEEIELSNAAGVSQDSVRYADEGDWAQRVRETTYGGWDWSSLADGGGRSLELRNRALRNDNGQNWGPSAASGGTPGTNNSLTTANVAPLISKVKHSPAVPASTQPVTISCEVTDESAAQNLTATLFWRDATTATPGAFQQAEMSGDGAGKFTVMLPPKADKTIVEFYVSATDGGLTRTWPAPTSEGQNANAQYQVDDEGYTGTDEIVRLVLTRTENDAFNALAASNPDSDRQFNCTFIDVVGSDTTVRYSSSMRIRGASSRTYIYKPLRISVPSDNTWSGATGFDCNPKYPWLQYIGMKLMQAAGLRAPDATPIELRRNGVEYSTGSANAQDFGRWVRLERTDSNFVDNHWPLDSNGNLYKKVRPDNSWAYRSGNVSRYLTDGWTKDTNAAASDWSDLDNLLRVVQTTAGTHFSGGTTTGTWDGTGLTSSEYSQVAAVADLDQWWRWFAIQNILGNAETNISNGADDDYSMYRGAVSGKFEFVPHDFDTIFGIGEGARSATSNAFNQTQDADILEAFLPLFGNAGTPGNLTARLNYYLALRDLLNTVFAEPAFSAFLDNHLASWVPANSLTTIKNYIATRRTAILNAIAADTSVTLPPYNPPASTSTNSLTSPHGTLMISEVLAQNVSAVPNGATFPDVIELYNSGTTPLDLSGKSLTDDPLIKDRYVFPPGTSIGPGAFLLVYFDDVLTAPGLHTGFSLDAGGDVVQLYDAVVAGQSLIDSIAFGPQVRDLSISRTGAGRNVWALTTPTLGSANGNPISTVGTSGIRINELLSNPDYLSAADFVELYNPATQPAAIGGIAITDDPINRPARHTLPALSFIGAQSFIELSPLGAAASPQHAAELPFKLSDTGGMVAILGANGAPIDSLDYDILFPDNSRGRSPDGANTLATFGLPANIPTPGGSNVAPPANILALLNGLRITELLYKPNNLEFVELQNISTNTLDLSGVRFTEGISYTFSAGTTLAPGAFIVVCKDRTAFEAQFGTGLSLAPGVFTGQLDNSGETIALCLPAPWNANILRFAYSAAWHPATESNYSLTTVDAPNTLARDWDEKETWSPSATLYGTPGKDGPPAIISALSATGVRGDPFSYQITATRLPTSYAASPLPLGLTVNTSTGLISGTPTASGRFDVNISATNAAGTDTRILVITLAASGPLTSFVWDTIPSPQQANKAFPATLAAKDAQGRTVTSFTGSMTIAASVASGSSGSTITITEAGPNSPDYFEIQNVSNETIDTSGWFLVVNNGQSGNLNQIHATFFNLPTSMTPGQVIYRTDRSTENYFGENIAWSSFIPGWLMLVDNTGVIRDFMAWGYTTEEIGNINIKANGFTLMPVAQSAWSGAGIPFATDTTSLLRTGSDDHNDASDWVATTDSRGTSNTGLTLPFPGGRVAVPVTPTSVTFSAGLWTGTLSIGTVATGIRLSASDGAGHTGQSNTFDTASALVPVITSPASAVAVIGQLFSYQILASNEPISFGATNLPAALGVNNNTGLISGTPLVVGSRSITLASTNAAGTSNATLTLQVQPDADGDGMGDTWETSFGLNPSSAADASLDKDGDGQSNLAEWLAGTSPNDPGSQLRIVKELVTGTGGTDLEITWTSTPGKRYRVLSRSNFSGGTWTEVTPSPIVATGSLSTFTHVNGHTAVSSFYRVEVVP